MDDQFSPTGAIELDTERFPIVVQRIRREARDVDVDWMIERYEELLDGDHRYGLIVWPMSGAANPMTPVQRKRVAEWEARVANRSKRVNVCTAVVLGSAVLRCLFTGYRWLSAPATPQSAFADLREAERWVEEMLRAEGIDVSRPRAAAG